MSKKTKLDFIIKTQQDLIVDTFHMVRNSLLRKKIKKVNGGRRKG